MVLSELYTILKSSLQIKSFFGRLLIKDFYDKAYTKPKVPSGYSESSLLVFPLYRPDLSYVVFCCLFFFFWASIIIFIIRSNSCSLLNS